MLALKLGLCIVAKVRRLAVRGGCLADGRLAQRGGATSRRVHGNVRCRRTRGGGDPGVLRCRRARSGAPNCRAIGGDEGEVTGRPDDP